MQIKGKKILLTGANGGIGNMLAKELDKKGAELLMMARSEERIGPLKNELTNEHSYYVCDLAEDEEREAVIRQIKYEHEELDILLNVAGIGVYRSLHDLTHGDWKKSFAINVDAPFYLIKELLSLLEKKESSRVINIGSGAGTIGMKGRTAYCSTKFAMRGMTLSLAEEYAGKQPQFVLITLGSTLTDFGPMTLAEKQARNDEGKAYFTVEWVVERMMEVIASDSPDVEYTWFPSEYGMGDWKKP